MVSLLKTNTGVQILLMSVLGALFGALVPTLVPYIAPIGSIFMSLLMVLVIPLVFVSVTNGVSSLGAGKKAKVLGGAHHLVHHRQQLYCR
jgi:Na+/H+-dicarboxylate symporter